jgi:hypothetical protein
VAFEIKHHALAESRTGVVSYQRRRGHASPTGSLSLSASTRDLFIPA